MKRNSPYPVGTPFWKYRLEKDEEEAMSDQSQKYIIPNIKVMPLAELTQIMEQSKERGIPVLVVPSPPETSNLPRLFWLEYDHSKLATKNEWTEVRKRDTLACWGVVYPDGGVSLQMGSYFGSLHDLKHYLSTTGEYSLTWLEEMQKGKTQQ